jgi:hypothetical protein
MRAKAGKTARVLKNGDDQGREVKPQETRLAGASTNLGAKESRYAVIARIPFSVVPAYGSVL